MCWLYPSILFVHFLKCWWSSCNMNTFKIIEISFVLLLFELCGKMKIPRHSCIYNTFVCTSWNIIYMTTPSKEIDELPLTSILDNANVIFRLLLQETALSFIINQSLNSLLTLCEYCAQLACLFLHFPNIYKKREITTRS